MDKDFKKWLSGFGGQCVYILWNREALIYIGKTGNLLGRVKTHLKTKPVTKVQVAETERADDLEKYLINTFKPVDNKQIPIMTKVINTTNYFNDILRKEGHGGGCGCPFCEGDEQLGRMEWVEANEVGCWKWVAIDNEWMNMRAGDLLYGYKGPFGRGLKIEECPHNKWCINPWHRKTREIDLEQIENERQTRGS